LRAKFGSMDTKRGLSFRYIVSGAFHHGNAVADHITIAEIEQGISP